MIPRTFVSVPLACVLSILIVVSATAETASGAMSDLGVIDFPNAGNAAAQEPFLTGAVGRAGQRVLKLGLGFRIPALIQQELAVHFERRLHRRRRTGRRIQT